MTSSHLRVEQGLEFDHGFIWMMYFFFRTWNAIWIYFCVCFFYVSYVYDESYAMNHMK